MADHSAHPHVHVHEPLSVALQVQARPVGRAAAVRRARSLNAATIACA